MPTTELKAKGTFCTKSPSEAVPWRGVGDAGMGQAPLGVRQTSGRTLVFHVMFFLFLDMLNQPSFRGFSSQSVSDSCALPYVCPCPMDMDIQAMDALCDSCWCCRSLPCWCRVHLEKLLPLPRYLPFPIFSPLTCDRKQHPAVPGPELPWNNLLGLINISASVLFNKYLL